MIADCPGCARDGADVREPRRARARLPWLGLLPVILYALAPKCPLCLVAYLSAFGVTVGMASLALSVLGPLAIASVVLALGFALWRAKVSSFRDRARRYSAAHGPWVVEEKEPVAAELLAIVALRSDQPRRAKKWSVGPWPWPIARACRIASVV